MVSSFLRAVEADRSSLAHHQVEGGGQPVPVGGFFFELGAPGGGERIELGLASGFALGPLGLDPTLLLKPVQGGVKGALLDLEHFARKLLNSLGNSPSVHLLGQEGFEDEKVEGALDEIAGFAHA